MKETKQEKDKLDELDLSVVEGQLNTEEVKEEDVVETTENGSETNETENKGVEPAEEESVEEDNSEPNSTNLEQENEEKQEKVEEKTEETKLEDKEIEKIEEPEKIKPKTYECKETKHRFDPADKVFVADFRNVRDDKGYVKIQNQYRFAPLEGEIEKVIITRESDEKIVQYKLKNKAGSLYDEEDVCATYEEAEELCKEKNRG